MSAHVTLAPEPKRQKPQRQESNFFQKHELIYMYILQSTLWEDIDVDEVVVVMMEVLPKGAINFWSGSTSARNIAVDKLATHNDSAIDGVVDDDALEDP